MKLQRLIDDLQTQLVQTGGFTANLETGAVPTEGFIVSVKGHERVIEGTATPADIGRYILDNHESLWGHGQFLGAWHDAGKTYLDVSRVYLDRTLAIAAGHEHGQQAIFDIAKSESIRLTA